MFLVSDEAFAVMMIDNYEERWKFQTIEKDKKKWRSDPNYQAKYTSSTKGVHNNSWSEEGMKSFYDWCRKIQELRKDKKSGMVLEEEVLAHYRGLNNVPSDSVSDNTEKSILLYEEFVEDGWQNLIDSNISPTQV